jgi:hypothetical protein
LAGIIAIRDETRAAAASAIINFIGDSLSRENPAPRGNENYHAVSSRNIKELAFGTVHDRDVNAAKNILRCGLTALAEGTSTSRLGSHFLATGLRKNDVSLLWH